MSKWQMQAPAQVAIPSSAEALDLLGGTKNHKLAQSVGGSSFSSSGTHQFPLTTPEHVLSQVQQSGFLDGSTGMARFGLDIGGTLCKVVYLEPAMDHLKKSGREGDFESTSAGCSKTGEEFTKGLSGRDGLARFATLEEKVAWVDDHAEDQVRATERPAAEPLQENLDNVKNGCFAKRYDPQRRLDVTEKNAEEPQSTPADHHSTDGAPMIPGFDSSEPSQGAANDRVQNRRTTEDVILDGHQCSCGTPGVAVSEQTKEERRMSRGMAGVEDDQKSKRQAQKMWVSSHEPVHLPGRGTLYFKCFETWRIGEFLSLSKKYDLINGGQIIGATGGGARKFRDQFLDIAGLKLQRADELKSLVRGIDFLIRHAHQESFEYPTGAYEGGSIQRPWESPDNSSDEGCDTALSEDESLLSPSLIEDFSLKDLSSSATTPTEMGQAAHHKRAQNATKIPKLKGPVVSRLNSGIWIGSNEPLHPYLVVNIGSGVSILRVDSPDKFNRVGGTSLGGSTFLGLAKALTGCESFEEAIDLATQGDSTHIDMLVGDIYGGDYTEMGLASTTVASSFGKLVQPKENAEARQPQHLAKAALLMVTNNIGSIACLHAHNAGVRSIVFTGSFLHNNKVAMRLLSVAMEFWSKDNLKAVFLRHEGHAGAMGALLSALESSNPGDSLLSS